MKKARPVGITDIGLYVPKPRMDLDVLIARRVGQDPRLERHLERAVKTTGQRSIRFPESWEDSATMAAAAAEKVLTRNNSTSLREMRYLVTGTESGLDHSKPLSAYVQGMLQSAGHEIPKTVSSYQIQHACAGATLGLVNVGSMIGMRGRAREYGVVIASDVARYTPSTTAEVTQGAGAAALLVETP